MLDFLFRKLADKQDDQGFWEHAEVLRTMLIRIVIVLVILSIVAFFFKSFLCDTVILGPLNADFLMYGWMCRFGKLMHMDSFCFHGLPLQLINIDLGGQFRWHMIISMVAGGIVTFPFAVWQLWLFVKPALKPGELKYSRGIIASISFLFFLGVLFGYYIILPLSVIFLANYELSPMIHNQITISSYISNSVMLPLCTGLVFELPVLIFFLAKIGLIGPKFLKKYRKHAVVVILLIAGIITPSTDIVSQCLVALPLYLLYEVSIYVAKKAYRSEATE